MRIFVYEHLCSGGLAGQPGATSLRREGLAMLSAVLGDLARCGGVQPLTLVEPDLVAVLRAIVPGGEIHPSAGNEELFSQALRTGARQFRSLARSADFTLVIAPEFDDLLLDLCVWAIDEGSRLPGPTPDAIRLTADKLALANHLLNCGIPTPPTQSRLGLASPPWPYPLVCKPRFGAGSLLTARVHDESEYSAFSAAVHEAEPRAEGIVQPWVPGLPASVAFLAGPAALLALPAAEQCLSDDGRFSYLGGRLPLAPPLQERARRLAERAVLSVPGLKGYFGVDLVLGVSEDGSDDVVIEINPRLTTSYVGLRRLARFNLMQALLAVTLGRAPEPLAWKNEDVRFGADGRID